MLGIPGRAWNQNNIRSARLAMTAAIRQPAIIPGMGLIAFLVSGSAYQFWGKAEFA